MKKEVVIKRNKYGIRLVLDENTPFSEILVLTGEKFKENDNFFKDAKMAISFEGRHLTNEEQMELIDVITENSSVKIVSIMDSDSELEKRMKERLEKENPPQQESVMPEEILPLTAYFHKGNLRSGQTLEWASSVTLVGDVNPGATIVSGGNIIVLGSLKGNACAGASGDKNCFIFALDMNPIQLQIGEMIAKSPDKDKKSRFARKKSKKTEAYSPQIAVVKDGFICIEPMEKGCLNHLG